MYETQKKTGAVSGKSLGPSNTILQDPTEKAYSIFIVENITVKYKNTFCVEKTP